MTSLQTVPCHYYGGIVLLEEKIVSNSPLDLQDMWMKDFIHTVLAHHPRITMQIKQLKVAFFYISANPTFKQAYTATL